MTQVLQQGTRKARTSHQCFHCYRNITPGTDYGYQNNKQEGSIYTLRWHLDCEELAEKCRKLSGENYYGSDEGWGPLRDDWADSGEYKAMIDTYRGEYPHVVCRMELTDQLFAAS